MKSHGVSKHRLKHIRTSILGRISDLIQVLKKSCISVKRNMTYSFESDIGWQQESELEFSSHICVCKERKRERTYIIFSWRCSERIHHPNFQMERHFISCYFFPVEFAIIIILIFLWYEIWLWWDWYKVLVREEIRKLTLNCTTFRKKKSFSKHLQNKENIIAGFSFSDIAKKVNVTERCIVWSHCL